MCGVSRRPLTRSPSAPALSLGGEGKRSAGEGKRPLVGIVMGSKSDWETMQHASVMLTELGVPHECRVVSAHRTPAWMRRYAVSAERRGLRVIIAGAGGAAHLP